MHLKIFFKAQLILCLSIDFKIVIWHKNLIITCWTNKQPWYILKNPFIDFLKGILFIKARVFWKVREPVGISLFLCLCVF